ncbi:MAG: VOC family protein [Dehalococcoidia bacterium]|nr:VOC family protein [Dehalococcoidia bacterium]
MSIVMTAITIDCADPRTQAEFWSAALGWEIESVEVWDAEISRGEKVVQSRESWSNIISAAPNAPKRINFAKVPEGKTVKNRLHFDLKVDDLDTEVSRLVELGASIVERRARAVDGRIDQGQDGWLVMKDPEGNEFCIG